ncbi:MAG: hypothetical protein V1492_02040 [Candidatus Micrarchaeota archaeon]
MKQLHSTQHKESMRISVMPTGFRNMPFATPKPLGELPYSEVKKLLAFESIEGGDAKERIKALRYLTRFPELPAVRWNVVNCMMDYKPEVRNAAVKVATEIKLNESDICRIEAVLLGRDTAKQIRLIECMEQLGEQRVAEALVELTRNAVKNNYELFYGPLGKAFEKIRLILVKPETMRQLIDAHLNDDRLQTVDGKAARIIFGSH